MGKSYTFVDVQVTDEGGRDQEFPECLLPLCAGDGDQMMPQRIICNSLGKTYAG